MTCRKTLYGFALLLALSFAFQATTVFAGGPQELVQKTIDKTLQEVLHRKEELNQNPTLIYPLVEDSVLPGFDFFRMSRLVLGKHWKRASPEQQKMFVEQFRELLVRAYAVALLNYSGQKVEYLPMLPKADENRVTVKTLVREGGGPEIPIDYYLYNTEAGWKVYDVAIDRISLVSTYRSSFSSKVRRYGLDGLIEKLKAKNAS